MARGAIHLGLCGAMGLAGCSGPAVPESATGTMSALAAEVVALTRLCLDHGLAPEPVQQGLRARGYAARVPLSPLMAPADPAVGLRVLRPAPCTLYVARSEARLASRAVENELRRQGFARSDDKAVWTDGTRRIRLERGAAPTARYIENNAAISLSSG